LSLCPVADEKCATGRVYIFDVTASVLLSIYYLQGYNEEKLDPPFPNEYSACRQQWLINTPNQRELGGVRQKIFIIEHIE
jgi:hypothetical protein